MCEIPITITQATLGAKLKIPMVDGSTEEFEIPEGTQPGTKFKIKEQGIQNIQTHRVLMWLQGAIAFLLHETQPKAKIEYVYPSEWRAKCGIKNGRNVRRDQAKVLDIEFVKKTYSIDVNDDIADAIGIGHAYVNQLSNEINWE